MSYNLIKLMKMVCANVSVKTLFFIFVKTFILIIGYSFIGCQNKSKSEQDAGKVIRVSLDRSSASHINEVFDQVQYLWLNEDSMSIGDAKLVLRDDGKIFILDGLNNAVLCYDTTGSAERVLRASGEGPGEFLEADWVSLDQANDMLFVYSESQGKIIKYDYSFNYINEYRLDLFVHSFEYIDGNFLIFSNDTRQSGIENNLTIMDEKGEVVECFLPIDMEYERISHDFRKYVSEWMGGFNLFLSYRNDVYNYEEGKLTKRYKFDFGKANVARSDVSGKFVDEIMQQVKGEKYVLNQFEELDGYIYIKVSNFSNNLQVFIDKEKYGYKVVKSFKFGEDVFGPVMGVWSKNTLLSFISSDQVEYLLSHFDSNDDLPKPNNMLQSYREAHSPQSLLVIGELKLQ